MAKLITTHEDNAGNIHITDGVRVASGIQFVANPNWSDDLLYFDRWIDDANDVTNLEGDRDQLGTKIAELREHGLPTRIVDKLGSAGRAYLKWTDEDDKDLDDRIDNE